VAVPGPRAVQRVLRELGTRVRAARVRAGLTQEDAAARSGIDYKRWQRIEQGGVNASVRTLTRVAYACGVTFFELVSNTAAKAGGGAPTRPRAPASR